MVNLTRRFLNFVLDLCGRSSIAREWTFWLTPQRVGKARGFGPFPWFYTRVCWSISTITCARSSNISLASPPPRAKYSPGSCSKSPAQQLNQGILTSQRNRVFWAKSNHQLFYRTHRISALSVRLFCGELGIHKREATHCWGLRKTHSYCAELNKTAYI